MSTPPVRVVKAESGSSGVTGVSGKTGLTTFTTITSITTYIIFRGSTFSGETGTLPRILNLHRRHLDPSQVAMIGARIKPMFEEEARARMTAGTNQFSPSAERRKAPMHASDEAAKAVNTSTRGIERASKVLADGAPELVAAVDSGQVSVTAAAKVAKLPIQQAECLKRRKEIWEAKQAAGGATCPTRADGGKFDGSDKGFAKETAEKTGVDKRTINRAISRAEKIPEPIRAHRHAPVTRDAPSSECIGSTPEKIGTAPDKHHACPMLTSDSTRPGVSARAQGTSREGRLRDIRAPAFKNISRRNLGPFSLRSQRHD